MYKRWRGAALRGVGRGARALARPARAAHAARGHRSHGCQCGFKKVTVRTRSFQNSNVRKISRASLRLSQSWRSSARLPHGRPWGAPRTLSCTCVRHAARSARSRRPRCAPTAAPRAPPPLAPSRSLQLASCACSCSCSRSHRLALPPPTRHALERCMQLCTAARAHSCSRRRGGQLGFFDSDCAHAAPRARAPRRSRGSALCS